MLTLRSVKPLDNAVLEDIGMTWHTDADGSAYISDQLVELSDHEAEAYYEAANALYDMFVEAAQHVLDRQLYYELGIPANLVKLVEDSWDKDDWHLYGRFDLAGGLDGVPIKLIEFNADTPTGVFETAIVQWAILKANGMDESRQFNNLHEMLRDNFRRLITGNDSTSEFTARYAHEAILFSSMRDHAEDERTTRYLQEVAHEAGFRTDYCYLDEAGFGGGQGVFNRDHQLADFWFKLFPWEDIASQELEVTQMLEETALLGRTRVINPAYTLIFQSKGLLKILCELFPDSPYLLKADSAPLPNLAQVRKKIFGREGANAAVLDASGRVVAQTDGPYAENKDIYQQLAEFAQDERGRNYQAGVFYAWEACALGFRRGGVILDDMSKFVGHIVV